MLGRVVLRFQRALPYSMSSQCHAPSCSVIPYSMRDYCNLTKVCYKCETELNPRRDTYFCNRCFTVQPVNTDAPPNYFECFGLESKYDLDKKRLKDTFISLQSQMHPDKFVLKHEMEQKYSAEQSTLLNEAYRTLKNPFSRALYLLKLNGLTIDESDISQDQELLMEIMELNQEVFECEKSDELQKYFDNITRKLSQEEVKISAAFEKNDMRQARDIAVVMKYYFTLQQNIVNRGQDLGIQFSDD